MVCKIAAVTIHGNDIPEREHSIQTHLMNSCFYGAASSFSHGSKVNQLRDHAMSSEVNQLRDHAMSSEVESLFGLYKDNCADIKSHHNAFASKHIPAAAISFTIPH